MLFQYRDNFLQFSTLVYALYYVLVAANLKKVLENPPTNKTLVFALVSH